MDQSAVPTKANLQSAKTSLEMARLGYDLLDRKRNVLIREIMELNEKARDIQADINAVFAEAYAAMREANIAMGEGYTRRFCAGAPTDNAVRIRERSAMGVLIPNVSLEEPEGTQTFPPGGCAALDVAYMRFKRAKELAVQLSMVESAAYRLAVAIKKAQKRANALKNIIIPKYEALIKYIAETLEERERDEFTRLKVIKTR